MDQTKRAHSIVTQHADADMGWDDIFDLLIENAVPEDVAYEVASDVRGEAPLFI